MITKAVGLLKLERKGKNMHYFSVAFSFTFICTTVLYKRPKLLNPEGRWSCIAHVSAEDMLKSAVTEEKKFQNN